MTDEVFFKRAKEAIAEHFNSHCKVGDLFEDSVKTTEEFVRSIWYHNSASDKKYAIFQVETSYRFGVFYYAFISCGEKNISFDVLNTIDYGGEESNALNKLTQEVLKNDR